MATAPSPFRTAAGNLCLGSAPDSWGIWFPEDEHQVSYTRFLEGGAGGPAASRSPAARPSVRCTGPRCGTTCSPTSAGSRR